MSNVIRGFLTRRKITIRDWIMLTRFNKQSPEERKHCEFPPNLFTQNITDEEIRDAHDNS